MVMDLFLFDLARANMVLGIEWFKSVSRVLSDYANMLLNLFGKVEELSGRVRLYYLMILFQLMS